MNKSASREDLDVLREWAKNPENLKDFKEHIKLDLEIIMALNQPNQDEIEKNVLHQIRKEKKALKIKRLRNVFKYAAVIAVLAASAWLVKINLDKGSPDILIIPDESIVLQKNDGSIETIDEQSTYSVIKASNGASVGMQEGKRITYSGSTGLGDTEFNKLIVPYGKKFELELADGTEVFLNAGSTIKYPVNFLPDQNRGVQITGEAFLNVSKDPLRPFIIETDGMEVEVLGTSFNIMAYPEDPVTETILVEGSVKLTSKKAKGSLLLSPGEKGTIVRENGDLSKEPVNTKIYTAWMKGRLVFRGMKFNNILKKLERHYNVVFLNGNTELGEELFNASFSSDDSIVAILDYFKKTHNIDYQIKENTVSIK